MNISIKKTNGGVIFSGNFESIRECVEHAILEGRDLRFANLRFADLHSANLHSANLHSANLHSADLRFADLHFANLHSANLHSADLRFADLRFADLRFADLHFANLHSANLRFADLHSANLHSANLHFANLHFADLHSIKSDFLAEVIRLPNELEFLRDALIGGKVNGSTYNDGECGCLAGTLAIAKGMRDYNGGPIQNGLTFHSDGSSPRERFFMAIKKGDTPKTNSASQIALDWTNEAIAIRDNIRAVALTK